MAPTTTFTKVAAININKTIKNLSFMFQIPLFEYFRGPLKIARDHKCAHITAHIC